MHIRTHDQRSLKRNTEDSSTCPTYCEKKIYGMTAPTMATNIFVVLTVMDTLKHTLPKITCHDILAAVVEAWEFS